MYSVVGSGRLPWEELATLMTTKDKQTSKQANTNREKEPYAVVVATKLEGIDIVLRGLTADQAEQIAARKNQEPGPESSIHALPEKELQQAK